MKSSGGRTITAIEVEALTLDLTEPFAIASGAQARAENLLVRVRLDDGTEGLGEAAPFPAVSGETQGSSLAAIERVKRDIVGIDAARTRKIAAVLAESIGTQPAARSAIEQAVFDALARHAGVPLWALFGGACAPVETDMTITAGDVEHARQSALSITERGIRTIKLKIGATDPRIDAQRVAAAVSAAPGARIFVDANGGYDVSGALTFLDATRAMGASIELFEQPVAADDLDGMVEVERRGNVPVCADESARSAADVIELVRRGAPRAINIKLMKCGVVEALAMWSVAQAAGLERMIGGMVESDLAMTFSAHFAHGLGGFAYCDLDTPLFVSDSPFEGGMIYEGGEVRIDHVERGCGVRLRAR